MPLLKPVGSSPLSSPQGDTFPFRVSLFPVPCARISPRTWRSDHSTLPDLFSFPTHPTLLQVSLPSLYSPQGQRNARPPSGRRSVDPLIRAAPYRTSPLRARRTLEPPPRRDRQGISQSPFFCFPSFLCSSPPVFLGGWQTFTQPLHITVTISKEYLRIFHSLLLFLLSP